MKASTIKKNWEKRIRETREYTNPYMERLITFLNNQNDTFCEEYCKYNGLKMVLLAQGNFLVPYGWDDFEEIKK